MLELIQVDEKKTVQMVPNMADDVLSTANLLGSLTEAISSAKDAFPSNSSTVLPPVDGISLLDVKNDLLLSYLHNLVFLILLRLRHSRDSTGEGLSDLNRDVTRKLIELKVYIERGVRPLEGRLRYQIDKVLRAAEESERKAAQSQIGNKSKKQNKVNGLKKAKANDENISEASNPDSDSEDSASDDPEIAQNDSDVEETLYRPNAAALAQKLQDDNAKRTQSRSSSSWPGVTEAYKPPRITPTTMPLSRSAQDRVRDGGGDYNTERSRRRKSNLLNEYIDEELSTAPQAQPSIGSNSTILARGRGGLSARDREKQRERTEYEERNFVRLPEESKAEKRKARARGEKSSRDMFGGEDWTGLGGLGDRINRSVQQGRGAGGASVLERREKRRQQHTEDGPRGDGLGIGETFAKRQKIMADRSQRKKGRR